MSDYKTHNFGAICVREWPDGTCTVSAAQEWIDGTFSSVESARAAGDAMVAGFLRFYRESEETQAAELARLREERDALRARGDLEKFAQTLVEALQRYAYIQKSDDAKVALIEAAHAAHEALQTIRPKP